MYLFSGHAFTWNIFELIRGTNFLRKGYSSVIDWSSRRGEPERQKKNHRERRTPSLSNNTPPGFWCSSWESPPCTTLITRFSTWSPTPSHNSVSGKIYGLPENQITLTPEWKTFHRSDSARRCDRWVTRRKWWKSLGKCWGVSGWSVTGKSNGNLLKFQIRFHLRKQWSFYCKFFKWKLVDSSAEYENISPDSSWVALLWFEKRIFSVIFYFLCKSM